MVVNTQATPGVGGGLAARVDQGLAGCVSGPVHNHDHSFCPGFGQIGGKRPHCKPILGALLSWVIQDTTWPPKPSAFLDVVARRPGFGVVH